jgi:nitrogenase molybdenum-iron protein beta chain
MPQIIAKATAEGKVPAGKYIIHCNTPSYVGSHVTGFANMVKGMVKYFSESTGKSSGTINVIPGWVEPSDMREIKRLLTEMGVAHTMFPDTSEVLDRPQTGHLEMFPKGGTTIAQLKATGDAAATLALGECASLAAAEALDAKCHVKFETLDLPIGLKATDRFIMAVRKVAGVDVPEAITADRGRLVDVMIDMHQYLYGKKVALFGDPDQLVALSEFLVSLDMIPLYVVTGTPGKRFEERMAEVLGDLAPSCKVRQGPGADMFLLHQWIKNHKPDLLIGNTYGKYIARDENLPFVRYGFPIIDRVGHSYFPTVGYLGGLRLLEKILSALMDRLDRDCPEEKVELQM